MMDIVLTTNSPGEVAAWLRPAVYALRRRLPDARITVFVPPCTFASGAECPVIAGMPEVDRVYGPRAFLQYVLFGWKPAGFHPKKQGVVCFLGGDLMFGAMLARRLRYPALAYTEGRARWHQTYRRFLVPDAAAQTRALAAGTPPEQVAVIGDLMLDAIRPASSSKEGARAWLSVPGGADVVSLFPGSRPFELQTMLPFFLRLAEVVDKAARRPVHFLLSLAPFAGDAALKQAAATVVPGVDGVTAKVTELPPVAGGPAGAAVPAWRLDTGKVTVWVYQGCQYDVMLASDLAVTIPGSNTAEMAGLGLPMVVALPLNRPEAIPLEGLLGLIGKVPWIGPQLKRQAVLKAASRVKFAALPNRKAGAAVVPEVRGFVRPEDVAIPVLDWLQYPDRRKAVSARLSKLMGGAGAADRLVDEIIAVAGMAADQS